MAFFFTEAQVVSAAIKAYRDHSELNNRLLSEWRQQGPCSLSDWTDPETELDQIGDEIKATLARIRPSGAVLPVVADPNLV